MKYTYCNDTLEDQYVVIEPHFDEFDLAAGEKVVIVIEDESIDFIDVTVEKDKSGTIVLCLNHANDYERFIVPREL